jgi:hypothetical protein
MASVGLVIGGIFDKFSGLLGAKSPIETINEYAKLGPGLQEAASGLTGFTSAMNKLINFDYDRLPAAANSIKKLASSINNIKVGKGIGQLADALERLSKSQGTINSLNEFSNFGQSFAKSNDSIDGFVEKISQLYTIDIGKLSSLGASLKSLGSALDSMASGSIASSAKTAISGLIEGAGQMFGIQSPIERLNEYVKMGPGLQDAASGLTGFTSAMKLLTQLNFDSLAQGAAALGEISKNIPNDATIQRMSALADSSKLDLENVGPTNLLANGESISLASAPTPTRDNTSTIARQTGSNTASTQLTDQPTAAGDQTATLAAGSQELMIAELKLVNTNAQELITQIKVVGDYQKRTYDKIKSSGGLW